MTYMYEDTKTWNPFKGCKFDCIYCKKSFQLQAKRQKNRCMKCYNYEPHFHPERLNKIPKADLVFACGNGDISFCKKRPENIYFKSYEIKTKTNIFITNKKSRVFG